MIFGRGAEEIRFCKNNHLNYEVIPGITAGIAAASLFEIPLTERGKNHMFLFYTGHRVKDKFASLKSVVNVLRSSAPVVIYMGLTNLSFLVDALLEHGIDTTLPVQILSNISQEGQKKYLINLDAVNDFLQNENPETPAIVIIGKYAYQI